MNRFWLILAVVVVVLFGLFFALKKPSGTNNGGAFDPKAVASDDHVRGARDKKVVLIEYGDFQCPGCAAMYPTVKSIEEKYRDQVTYIYRYLPLTSIHPNAYSAARAAEAAAKQGKFYEMHDKLYDTQQMWGQITTNQQGLFEGYAQELGLNVEQFKKDYASEETSRRINRDRESSQTFKITATPAFVLNGELMSASPSNREAFENALKNIIIKNYGSVNEPATDAATPAVN